MPNLIALAVVACSAARPRPEVSTSIGNVRGNAPSPDVDEFLGIPYAVSKRFEPPSRFQGPYKSDPFDASQFGPACLQYYSANETYGVEDGLPSTALAPRCLERTLAAVGAPLT